MVTAKLVDGRSRRFWIYALLISVIVLLLISRLVPRSADAQEAAPPVFDNQVYFNETGQVVSGPFLSAWLMQGGIDKTGLPVTGPVNLGDRWVQWFEYARLEVVGVLLEEAAPEQVRTAPIGSLYVESMQYPETNPGFAPHWAFEVVEITKGRLGFNQGLVPPLFVEYRLPEQLEEGRRYFPETGHTITSGFLDMYQTGINEDRLGLPISEEFAADGVTYQYFEYGAMQWTEVEGVTLIPLGIMDAIVNGAAQEPVAQPAGADVYEPGYFVLNNGFAGQRWIDINLSNYTLTAFVGDVPVFSTLVVVGAAVSPTVEGVFSVYWKLESQDMRGVGWNGVEYFAPDVPWVMYFYQDWAIHGAYWRNGFGYAASHGCVNVPVAESALLWAWADVGTKVVVHS